MTVSFLRSASLAIVLSTMALSGPAFAQNAQAAIGKACASDVKTLCSGIDAGGGRIKKCITDKRDLLSSECKAAISSAQTPPKN